MGLSLVRRPFSLFVATLLAPCGIAAQEISSIRGEVVATGTGEPLPRARVTIAALAAVVITGDDGRFLITNVTRGTHSLRVIRLGYRPVTRELSVGVPQAEVTIEMTADPLRLDEMVVTGYSETRRRHLTGAISSLKPAEDIADVPATSVTQGLQGRIPGVHVVQPSGVPGTAISVRVRGSSTISAGNEPLYVVDGVPLTQGSPQALGLYFGGQGTDAISDLDLSEIESIEVLKDASAAAIYGARATNGVVLITTRRGTAGRPEFRISGYYGTQKEWRRLDMLNAEQYLEVYNEGFTNRWGAAADHGYDAWHGYSEPGRRIFQPGGPPGTDTDWLSQVLRRASVAQLEGSVRGGTERARYFVSGSSLVQEGIIRSMSYRRLNGRVNLDFQPYERLGLGTSIALARGVTERAEADNSIYSSWSNSIAQPPTEPVHTRDGGYYETFYANPVAIDREREAFERGTRTLLSAFADHALSGALRARFNYGLDQLTTNSRAWDSPAWGFWETNSGRARSGARFITKVLYEGTVHMNTGIRPGHDLTGVLGMSHERNTDDWQFVQGTQLPTEHFKYVVSAATIDAGYSNRADWGLISYFGRLSHTFRDRLTTTLNFRRDGSSRFGRGHRFGTFPSASAVWRISDESFMQRQQVFGNLALRASYGLTGNQPLANFGGRALFRGGVNYADQAGIAPAQLANPSLRWEKTAQLNLGADISLLGDRLTLGIDYYDKQTEDLLIARPVPQTTGFSVMWDNVGGMRNRGTELAATLQPFRSVRPRGFNWATTVTVSRNRNRVTGLFEDQPLNGDFSSRVEVGEPLGFFFGHVTDRLFQEGDPICRTAPGETAAARNARCAAAGLAFQHTFTAAGDIRFRDLNGDGVITAEDRTKIGSPWPDYEGGITTKLSYAGFDVSGFLQFSLGNDVLFVLGRWMLQYGSLGDNHTTRALDRWTPARPNTTEPRAVDGDPNGNTRISNRFVEDGSFWRIKNVVIGYTLPARIAPRLGYRTARVFVQGQNLLTFTRYSGFDPEVNTLGASTIPRGTDFYTVPHPRTLTFGFNLGL
jgi:TonB-dependent starch-binding outer membrane protein SusC